METNSSNDAATSNDGNHVAAPPLPSSSNHSTTPQETNICCVIQRFRKASLLVDETHTVTVGGEDTCSSSVGLLAYASFGKGCTRNAVLQLARTILNLPVLTSGLWGDGSEPASVLDIATQKSGGVAVMLVPQANLISKVSINDCILCVVLIVYCVV